MFFFCSHWSLVDVPLISFCPADHVPDWQLRIILGMVEARSVNVKKTTTTTTTNKDPNRDKKLCDSTSNGTDQYQNGSSNLLVYMYVCMVITYSKSMDQPGKVANPARGQLNRENEYSRVPVRA